MRITHLLLFVAGLSLSFQSLAQRAVDHADFDTWNRITGRKIATNGKHILYHITPNKGDQTLVLVDNSGNEVLRVPRGSASTFTYDSKYVIFKIVPALEEVNDLRRKKTKPKDMPKDTLGIFEINSGKLTKIPRVKSFKTPEKWSDYIFFQLEEALPDSTKKSNSKKKASKKNGYQLIVHKLSEGKNDTIPFVTDYQLAEEGQNLLYHTTGRDSTEWEGVYYQNLLRNSTTPLCRAKGTYKQLTLDKKGDQVAFLSHLGDPKSRLPQYQLRYWSMGSDSAMVKAFEGDAAFPNDWMVSEYGNLTFSDNGALLFFGTAPKPLLPDTAALPEEMVQVEVWRYNDEELMTMQNVRVERERRRNYAAIFRILDNKVIQLSDPSMASIDFTPKRNTNYALGTSTLGYGRAVTWTGNAREDVYLVDVRSGERTQINEGLHGRVSISTAGNYLLWFDHQDTSYYTYNIAKGLKMKISNDLSASLVDEMNDRPMKSSPYGVAGFTANDESVIIYTRYDLWEVNLGTGQGKRLTSGRESRTEYRYNHLDPEDPTIGRQLLLHTFNEGTKKEGYVLLDRKNSKVRSLISGDYSLGRVTKARDDDQIVFTIETFEQFPDLQTSKMNFKDPVKVSNANPQKSSYKWGTVEMYSWTSLDGDKLDGLLYKPEDFDPNKKYPMITYFYERNSDNIHRHWGVVPIRSIINPTFYTSRGYIVFVPDIPYRIGYPGESCYNAVIPGVTALMEEGFIDRENIGVQGHSWGGYQIAYLLTKTNIFKAAESGAPVVNMISAYGGIRWGTGMSRMFQYEKTQSRIGGTLWEYPIRYVENSPIFFMDKVETPVLIMHNDNDSAVPWYQGIEMYMSLRRLNKPAWMLNYNGEPHWPTKYENIRDFNVRMQQFFDYYLKGAAMPAWMGEGIPATLKGVKTGYELMEDH